MSVLLGVAGRSASGGGPARSAPLAEGSIARPARGETAVRGAVVTGATGGIGGALARRLAADGTAVLATGRAAPALETLAAAGCRVWQADLLETGAAEALAGAAHRTLPAVDLLVVAAGSGLAGPVAATPPARLVEVLELNLSVPVQVVRAFLPGMVAAGRGRIVLVGSVAGALAVRDEAVYSAAKAGLAAFAAALRSELGRSGVSVTLAVPGVVDTEFFRRRGSDYARAWPRPQDPDTVAGAILAGARRGRAEVWTPRWLGAVARFRGIAPRTYHRLADVTGATSSARVPEPPGGSR